MKRRLFIQNSMITAVGIVISTVPFSPVFARLQRKQKSLGDMAKGITNELQYALLETLEAQFPRCLDTEHGGFLTNFNVKWENTGPDDKTLEYQARQTRAASQAALFNPKLKFCRQAAEHGFRYLQDNMWDHQYGGWYRKVNRFGRPLESKTKHGHGIAYAIQACIEHHRLTGNPESLELACEAFSWLEKHAYDTDNGGYYNFYHRDGSPIISVDQNPLRDHLQDHMGTPIGLRDANTSLDLMEGMADLYDASADPKVGERLNELVKLSITKLIIAPGLVHKFYHRDWSPASSEVQVGTSLQASMIMAKAAATLDGKLQTETRRASQLLVNSCIQYFWDDEYGGFYYSGNVNGEHARNTSKEKAWWVQAEGLRALLMMAESTENSAIDYFDYFIHQWDYIRDYIIDSQYKGWIKNGRDTLISPGVKADEWKDAAHEVRAMIECIKSLSKRTINRVSV